MIGMCILGTILIEVRFRDLKKKIILLIKDANIDRIKFLIHNLEVGIKYLIKVNAQVHHQTIEQFVTFNDFFKLFAKIESVFNFMLVFQIRKN